MEIKRLDWDSDFLGLEVYGVSLHTCQEPEQIQQMVDALRQSGAGLAYLFVETDDPMLKGKLADYGAILYDEKLTYGKLLGENGSATAAGTAGTDIPAYPGTDIRAYRGAMTDQLLRLAILAGHESRFRKDPRLLPFFEPLYQLWMSNSLKGTMADVVFVCGSDSAVKGFVTCKIREDRTGSIGLIATDGAYQGQGIGQGLIGATDTWYTANRIRTSTVVTQQSKVQACRFYEKAGFTIRKTEYIYHLWLK